MIIIKRLEKVSDDDEDLVHDNVSSIPETLKTFLNVDYAYAIVSEEWIENNIK